MAQSSAGVILNLPYIKSKPNLFPYKAGSPPPFIYSFIQSFNKHWLSGYLCEALCLALEIQRQLEHSLCLQRVYSFSCESAFHVLEQSDLSKLNDDSFISFFYLVSLHFQKPDEQK